MSDKIRAERDLLGDILVLAEERDAAYEARGEPGSDGWGRWQAAKQAYADKRREIRQAGEYIGLRGPAAKVQGSTSPPPVTGTGAVHGQEG